MHYFAAYLFLPNERSCYFSSTWNNCSELCTYDDIYLQKIYSSLKNLLLWKWNSMKQMNKLKYPVPLSNLAIPKEEYVRVHLLWKAWRFLNVQEMFLSCTLHQLLRQFISSYFIRHLSNHQRDKSINKYAIRSIENFKISML